MERRVDGMPPEDDDALDVANGMLQRDRNRTVSPSGDAVEGAPGANTDAQALDGQLGPDEISDPDELLKNHEAKRHQ
jgi:hypothetical protein